MKMKIALAATGALAALTTASTVYLFGALGRISWTGYLVGWSEARSGKQIDGARFAERISAMQRAQHKADHLHRQWHADNPGKSCEEMPDTRLSTGL